MNLNFHTYQLNSSISVSRVLFSRMLEGSSVFPVFKNVGGRSTAKNYHPVSILSVISKVFEKLEKNRTVDHLRNVAFFLIVSLVLVLLNQLQIF